MNFRQNPVLPKLAKIAHLSTTRLAKFGICMMLVLPILSGCASLVTPNFTQTLTELRSGDYTLDPEHAYVNFKVDHLGLSKIVGRFNVIEASLDFDPEKLTELRLQGLLESNSIDVNNEDLEDMLNGGDWFDADNHSQITFTSTSVVVGQNEEIDIKGDLTIRGVTKEISLITRFNGGADNILTGKYTVGFTASTSIQRSDYGIDGFAALIGNDIDIEMHGEFQRN